VSAEDSFDVTAAGLRADSAELAVSVEVLAAKLEDALPAETRVVRRARRPLSRQRRVHSIEVRMGNCRFTLVARGGGAAECWRERQSGGIAIKREPLNLEAWVDALTDELRASAEQSARARDALDKLVG
jgi:hypothetical protein